MILRIDDYLSEPEFKAKVDQAVDAAVQEAALEYFERVTRPKIEKRLEANSNAVIAAVLDIANSLTLHAAKKIRLMTGDTTPPAHAKTHTGPPDRKCSGCRPAETGE